VRFRVYGRGSSLGLPRFVEREFREFLTCGCLAFDHALCRAVVAVFVRVILAWLRFDVLACPHCPGRLTLVALIYAPAVITRILAHLGLPVDVPVMQPSRARRCRSTGVTIHGVRATTERRVSHASSLRPEVCRAHRRSQSF